MITVSIVEDDPEIRAELQRYLHEQITLECRYGFDSVELILEFLQNNPPPHVILMDIGLPGMSGISGVGLIKDRFPDVEIIMLTVYNDFDKIFGSLCAGASGYLLKSTPLPEIKEGIEMLRKGGAPMSAQIARKVVRFFNDHSASKPETPVTPLSEREKEIVIGIVDGLSYKMVATRMNISIETVRFHIKNIYRKLHVHCKAEVIAKSLRGEI
jgi:DNA-binding NarL/FixJ family response regulator